MGVRNAETTPERTCDPTDTRNVRDDLPGRAPPCPVTAPPMRRKLSPVELGRRNPSEVHTGPRHPVSVVLENVRSAHNVGAVLRTADALALAHVYLCGITPPGDHIAVFKTALGADATVPWSHHPDAQAVVEALHADGVTVAVLELTDAPSSLDALTAARFPLALVVGNEVEGVSEALVAAADLALELPQWGAKHSLNASVAFGVAAYDLVRHARRLGLPGPD